MHFARTGVSSPFDSLSFPILIIWRTRGDREERSFLCCIASMISKLLSLLSPFFLANSPHFHTFVCFREIGEGVCCWWIYFTRRPPFCRPLAEGKVPHFRSQLLRHPVPALASYLAVRGRPFEQDVTFFYVCSLCPLVADWGYFNDFFWRPLLPDRP